MHFFKSRAELRVEVDLPGIANEIKKSLLKVCPLLRIGTCASRIQGALAHAGAKLLGRHRSAAHAENFVLPRHTANAAQFIKRWHQLPPRQVAGCAKDHE